MYRLCVLQPTTAHWFLVVYTSEITQLASAKQALIREQGRLRKCCTLEKCLHCWIDLWFEIPKFKKHGEKENQLFSRLALLNVRDRRSVGNGGLLLLLLFFLFLRSWCPRKKREANDTFFVHLAQASRCLLYLCL